MLKGRTLPLRGKPPTRHEPRRCHCGARLSSLNGNATCWAHTTPTYPRGGRS